MKKVQKEKLIAKVRKIGGEILPIELSSKRKRLAHVKNMVSQNLTKEERRQQAKDISKKVRRDVWNWTTSVDRAAYYVAEDRMSLKHISSKTGVPTAKIKRWTALNGEFTERVKQYREQLMAKLLSIGIGNKNNRVNVLDDIHEKMRDIIRQRQYKYAHRKQPGVNTGLMVRTVKAIGHGSSTKIVRGWDFDKELVHEIRETQVQLAKELGQWSEKTENSNVVLVREYAGVSTEDV